VFVVVVLGAISKYYNFSLSKMIRYFKSELFIVLGTGSSEPVLPRMIEKLERLGCAKPVVGLVIPTGYSFNLDGTSIYLSMCVLFIAQAYGINLSLEQQITILTILLFTSKGAAGVAGSAFVVLAATVSATGFLPVEGLALLLGIDRFMSSVRAMINLIGNAAATIVVAKMENEFDAEKEKAEYAAYFDDAPQNEAVVVGCPIAAAKLAA
jgi:aerobic C4-dicarboxylate transport protein